MLSLGCSGFGWNLEWQCIDCEPKIFDTWSHPNAKGLKHKSFSFYDDLTIVFGKDRAAGSRATTTTEVGFEPTVDEDNDDILNNRSPNFHSFYIPDPMFIESPTSENFPSALGRRGAMSSMPIRNRRSWSLIGEYNEVVREGFQLLT